jgi:hypothetical protein
MISLTESVVALEASYENTAVAEMVARWYTGEHVELRSVCQLGITFSDVKSLLSVTGVAGVHTRKFSVVVFELATNVRAIDADLPVSVPSNTALAHVGELILSTVESADEHVMVVTVDTTPAALTARTLTALVTETPVRMAVLTSSFLAANANKNSVAGLPMLTTPDVLSPRRSTARAAVGTVLPPGWIAAFRMLLKKLIEQLIPCTELTVALARTCICRVIRRMAGWVPAGAAASFFKLAEILALCPLTTGEAVQVAESKLTLVMDRS